MIRLMRVAARGRPVRTQAYQRMLARAQDRHSSMAGCMLSWRAVTIEAWSGWEAANKRGLVSERRNAELDITPRPRTLVQPQG